MSMDWVNFCQDCNNDVETVWIKFKNKLCEGIKKFTPVVKNFNGGKGCKWPASRYPLMMMMILPVSPGLGFE